MSEEKRIAGWSFERIAQGAGGRLVGAELGAGAVRSVSSDTRQIEPGALFVALSGERFDGHDFLEAAREEGATAALIDREERAGDFDGPVVVVEDTLRGLQRLGHEIWREATESGALEETIALTGSNGKTTTKELMRALWSTCGEVWATPGNLNNHIGVPLTLCGLPRSARILVVEMGANGPSDIGELIRLAPGRRRCVTSIGAAHLEGFGSLDGVRRAKRQIFEVSGEETTAVVPHDEAEGLILPDFTGQVVRFGELGSGAELEVELLGIEGDRWRWRVVGLGRSVELELGIPGEHQGGNLACALGTLWAARDASMSDLVQAKLQEKLDAVELPGGRWRRVEVGELEFVDDAYNANPTSVVASVETFARQPVEGERQRVVVLGEMRELGREAKKWHLHCARTTSGVEGIDGLVVLGPYGEAMASAARERGDSWVACVSSAEEAAALLVELGPARVLLKGSRGARLETIIEAAGARCSSNYSSGSKTRSPH